MISEAKLFSGAPTAFGADPNTQVSLVDAGMRDMWSFLIARDTMHQQQWLAVIEELGGHAGTLPIPNSFPQEKENQKFNYNFFSTSADGSPPPPGRCQLSSRKVAPVAGPC